MRAISLREQVCHCARDRRKHLVAKEAGNLDHLVEREHLITSDNALSRPEMDSEKLAQVSGEIAARPAELAQQKVLQVQRRNVHCVVIGCCQPAHIGRPEVAGHGWFHASPPMGHAVKANDRFRAPATDFVARAIS